MKMPIKFLSLALLSLVLTQAWAGEITGTVKWEGPAPKMKPLKMDADPACMAQHEDSDPALSEVLVLGENNELAHIFVRVISGLPDKKYDPPKEAAILDQKGCIYVPHVMGVMVDQDVRILNSDGILHNVNVQAKENRAFNLGMPKGTTEAVKTFSRPEHMITLKCNVHPWMKGFIGVMDHPFFDVTDLDGKFTIKGLEPGTYEIEAWHERAGTRTAKVTIGSAADKQSVDITFSRP